MKIQSLYTHSLRNDAHFQFHTEFKILVERSGAETLRVKTLFDKYLPIYEKEDDALKKINKSALTAKINDADKARDEIWYGLVSTNQAALNHFSPQAREAAVRLQIVFDTYGNVARKPLNDQTSALYNILKDFREKHAGDIALVGASRWVEELEERNQAFASLVRERFDESAARTGEPLKDIRAEINAAYRAIVRRINAIIEVDGEAGYETFVNTLNVVIAKYMSNAGRSRRAASEQGEPSQEEQAT